MKDIEALLIHENQPNFNSKHKKSYGGRSLVAIAGGDYKPLKWIAASSDGALTKWEKDGGWEAIDSYL